MMDAGLAKQTRDFFKESAAGANVLKQLNGLIERKHMEAERDMEHCRDHMMKAAGVRDALNEITMLMTEAKKPDR